MVGGLVAFIVSFASSESAKPSISAPRSKQEKPPPADIRIVKDAMIISNPGPGAWAEINIFVNSDPPFGYGVRLNNVAPLESKAIPLREFTKPKTGERFNPSQFKVTRVWVGGSGYTYEAHGFK